MTEVDALTFAIVVFAVFGIIGRIEDWWRKRKGLPLSTEIPFEFPDGSIHRRIIDKNKK